MEINLRGADADPESEPPPPLRYVPKPHAERRKTGESLRPMSRKMRKHPTVQEAVLWKVLSSKTANIGAKFVRQFPLFGFIPDFYCQKWGIIVEVDGPYHERQIEYDRYRDSVFHKHGRRVLRFTNDQVRFELPEVVKRIRSAVSICKKEWK